MTNEPKTLEEAHEERRKILFAARDLEQDLALANRQEGHTERFAALFAELQVAHARAAALKVWIKARNAEQNAALYRQAHDPNIDVEKNGHNKQLRAQNSELKAMVRDYHQKFNWLMSNIGNCECTICRWLVRDQQERQRVTPSYAKRAAEKRR